MNKNKYFFIFLLLSIDLIFPNYNYAVCTGTYNDCYPQTYQRTRVAQPQQLFGGQPAVGSDRKLQETTSEKLLNSTSALYSLGEYFSKSKQTQLLNEQIKEQKLRNKILEEQLKYKQGNSKK